MEEGIYEGDWKNDQKDGKGVLKFSDGTTFEGEWKDDIAHGYGKMIFPNSDRYIGSFQNGKKQGFGTFKSDLQDNNQMKCIYYRGEWHQDSFNGVGFAKFSNGDQYIGNFKNGLFEGYGQYTSQNGSIFKGQFQANYKKSGVLRTINFTYTGDFVKNNKEGKGKLELLQKKESYEGDFYQNMKHGKGKYKFSDGSSYEGDWKYDKQQGFGVFIDSKGQKCEGFFEQNQFVR